MAYAAKTTVPAEKSIAEIQIALSKAGAKSFSYGTHEGVAHISFIWEGMPVKMIMDVPKVPTKDATQAEIKNFDQARRTRWRQMLVCIKSKLEFIHCGIETFEQAFMPHIVLENGELLGEKIVKNISALNHTDPGELLGFVGKEVA